MVRYAYRKVALGVVLHQVRKGCLAQEILFLGTKCDRFPTLLPPL